MIASSLKMAILKQREKITALLGRTLHDLAGNCAAGIGDRAVIEALLGDALSKIAYCKHLFVMDVNGLQITNNITRDGPDSTYLGRNRSDRPYMRGIVGSTDFKLSEAYISHNKKRPMLTAIQVIRNGNGEHIGFLGADYDLRELPGTEGLYPESQAWRQIKGDPAIRGGLFQQQRAESLMDGNLDVILPLMHELMTQHGVFHGKLHFSSSRATIWLAEDPYVYRILNIDELNDPDICLAYPQRPYTSRAIVPPENIPLVFQMFRELRFADDTIYLRSGSLNICNGLVSLNFSCDGSHYVRYDEFLGKGMDIWVGHSG
ncbi:MAG: PDC sensor domain-containing protein [Alphaproteobacteria bacterium]|nr:PDC sensor domain-containing protein [Alphaproteobacteria bacterium]